MKFIGLAIVTMLLTASVINAQTPARRPQPPRSPAPRSVSGYYARDKQSDLYIAQVSPQRIHFYFNLTIGEGERTKFGQLLGAAPLSNGVAVYRNGGCKLILTFRSDHVLVQQAGNWSDCFALLGQTEAPGVYKKTDADSEPDYNSEIHFARGTSSAQFKDIVIGPHRYTLSAQAGQQMRVHLSADNAAMLDVLRPGGKALIHLLSDEPAWSGGLPQSGKYTLQLVPVRGPGECTVRIAISPFHQVSSGQAGERAPSSAAALPTGSLLQRAARIVDLRFYAYDRDVGATILERAYEHHWKEGGRAYAYDWLSDHAFLILQRAWVDDPTSNAALRYDLDTHQFTPLPALTQLLNASECDPEFAQLSPDGQRLLWGGDPEPKQRAGITQSVLHGAWADGTHHFVTPPQDNLESYWMGDGRHWINFQQDSTDPFYKGAFVYDPDSPVPVRHLTFAGDNPLRKREFLMLQDGMILPNDHLILPDWGSDVQPIVFEMNLAQYGRVLRSVPMRFPSHAVSLAKVSARGDRIAWLLHSEYRDYVHLALWVSDAQGDHLQEVGYVDLRGVTPYQAELASFGIGKDSLRWLPDGRHLSFIFRDALYIVPVD